MESTNFEEIVDAPDWEKIVQLLGEPINETKADHSARRLQKLERVFSSRLPIEIVEHPLSLRTSGLRTCAIPLAVGLLLRV